MTTEAPRRTRTPYLTTVLRREELTPSFVRLVLGGDDLANFTPSPCSDSYVKLQFGDRLRTYTVRGFDERARELTLDIVTHGDRGLAGPWVRAVQPGDQISLLGPGGGWSPDAEAPAHLLVGDESALPAIAVALERIPAGAAVSAYVEVADATEEVATARPVTWVHRGDAEVGARLVEAVTATPPAAGVDAFVHGEAGFVKQLRAWLKDAGVPRESISISGYWRVGADDEGWRAIKRTFDTD